MERQDQLGIAYIALGSNIGDRIQTLKSAIQKLNEHAAIEVEAESDVYETDPVGYTEQPAFLNMVVRVRTSLMPEELLKEQLRIEEQLGRKRQVRWGPRTIDLDLLLYDNVSMETDVLILPHPRMMERAFVLVPLHDVLSSEHPLALQVSNIAKESLQMRKEGIIRWTTIN